MIREILKMGDPRLLRVAPVVPDAIRLIVFWR